VPALAGLVNLSWFDVGINQLTGPLPSLAGLPALRDFYAYTNQLSGGIPPLDGLAELRVFNVGYNQLTGAVPSLAGLDNLGEFRIDGNQLRGPLPEPPASLVSGAVCPNHLDPNPSPAWDAITGVSPWFQNCTPLPEWVFADGFDG
jgi:hypothetical protein